MLISVAIFNQENMLSSPDFLLKNIALIYTHILNVKLTSLSSTWGVIQVFNGFIVL